MTGGDLPPNNAWNHFAFVKNGSVLTRYVNGVAKGTNTGITGTTTNTSPSIYIGIDTNGSSTPYNGYLDELRIAKGLARWNSNFTPPTSMSSIDSPKVREGSRVKIDGTFYDLAEIKGEGEGDAQVELSEHALSGTVSEIYGTAITGGEATLNQTMDEETVLLLHLDGTDNSTTDADFVDSSRAGHAVTQEGNAKLENTEKKFGDTSAYFDGSGDYLKFSDSSDWDFGTGDFTVDFWIRDGGGAMRGILTDTTGSPSAFV